MSEDHDALLAKAYYLLKWCRDHEGECLADHPNISNQISDIVRRIEKAAARDTRVPLQ